MLQEMDAEQTREACHVNTVLIYGGDFGVEAAFGAIAGKFLKFKAVFCVGLVVGELVAYINKKDHKRLPSNFGINDSTGVTRNTKVNRFENYRSTEVVEQTLETVNATMAQTVCNIVIIAPCVGDYSFRQLLNIVKKLIWIRS